MTTGSAIGSGKEMKSSPTVALGATTKKTVSVSLDRPLEIQEIKTEKAVLVKDIYQSLKKRIGNAKKNVEKLTSARVIELEEELEKTLKEQKSQLEKNSALKIGMNGRQLQAQLADLEQSSVVVSDIDELRSLREMKRELETFLPSVLDKELWTWFSGEMQKLRTDLENLKEQVTLVEDEKRRIDEDASLRRQIAQLKQYEDVNMLKGDVMKKVELSGTIPKATRDLLFHPVWLTRKLEKEFTVVMDKSRDTHSKSEGCFIAGTARDVDACIQKLETGDFVSGKKTMLLDGKTISTIMSMHALDLEKEFQVIFFAPPGGVELTIYGSEKSVTKAVAKLGAVRELKSAGSGDEGNVITSEKVKCNSAVAKAIVNSTSPSSSIEEKCGVSLTLSPGGEDSPRDSFVVIRGPHEGVASALHEIHLMIARMRLETVEDLNKDALEAILLGSGSSKKGYSQVKLAMRFNELKKRAVFVQFKPDAVDVAILDSSEDDNILTEFYDICEKAIFQTETIILPPESNSRIWSDPAICKLVSSSAEKDMEISLRRSQENENILEVWGSSERAIETAKRLIEEVHVALIVPVPEEAIKPMLENKCQVLQSIQSEATVSVNLSRFENEISIYGLDSSKRKASNLFSEFFESVRQALLQSTIKTIPIASDEIGRLIGPKGKIMNGIKERSGLDEIRISQAEMKVYLTGSNACIDHAISFIEEELSARKDAAVFQIGLAEDEVTVASLTAKEPGQQQKKTNEWVGTRSAEPQALPVAENQDLFPSLGAAQSAKPAKTKWRK